jgi:hypothetical protein
MLNFNEADAQRSFDIIPEGTVATVHMTVRPGRAGEGDWSRRSKDGNSEGLNCEFTVVDGPHAKRKFWSLLTISGTTPGHAQAAEISGTSSVRSWKVLAASSLMTRARPHDRRDGEWRAAKNGGGKWTKPPRQARDPSRSARSNDPATWSDYDQAVARVAAGDADGIGFALAGSAIGAADLDHCREPNGSIASWAQDLSNEAATPIAR